jgi:hypothetical protein
MGLNSIHKFQEKSKSMSRHGVCAIRRDIGDRDPQLSRDTDIDDIKASGDDAHVLKLRKCTQAFGVKIDLICDKQRSAIKHASSLFLEMF